MNNERPDLRSTDYDSDKITNYDRRFEQGKKDCAFFHILGVVSVVVATIFMYAFGCTDPSEMKYLFGMPLWFTGVVIIYLVMFVIGIVYMSKWEEFPFTAREEKKKKEEDQK